MTDTQSIREAAKALTELEAPARAAAAAIEDAFEQAGRSLAKSLARAAADGRISLDELAEALIAAANAAAAVREESAGAGRTIVNLNLGSADAGQLIRSEGQIAQALARAARMGGG